MCALALQLVDFLKLSISETILVTVWKLPKLATHLVCEYLKVCPSIYIYMYRLHRFTLNRQVIQLFQAQIRSMTDTLNLEIQKLASEEGARDGNTAWFRVRVR